MLIWSNCNPICNKIFYRIFIQNFDACLLRSLNKKYWKLREIQFLPLGVVICMHLFLTLLFQHSNNAKQICNLILWLKFSLNLNPYYNRWPDRSICILQEFYVSVHKITRQQYKNHSKPIRLNQNVSNIVSIHLDSSHRAMCKLGAKNKFVLCPLLKNMKHYKQCWQV